MNVVPIQASKLEYRGCGRMVDDEAPEQAARALVLYFNRAPTDDEMRFISECSGRTVELIEVGK